MAPVQNETDAFRDHVRECLVAVAVPGLDVELMLIDNQSINGCCHGLPREVLIVRMELEQAAVGLWSEGRRLASGAALLWFPELAACPPDRLVAIVQTAANWASTAGLAPAGSDRRTRVRFITAAGGAALLLPAQRSGLDRLARIPILGRLCCWLAERTFRSVVPIPTGAGLHGAHADEKPVIPSRVSEQGALMSALSDRPRLTARMSVADGSGRRSDRGQISAAMISVIITAHNEGEEVLRTVESVRNHTRMDHEIIVVDDGSSDGSCEPLGDLGVRVIRSHERIGVAHSRDLGSRAAVGDVLAYLDGHQRVDLGCLERSSEVALRHAAITCPPCRPLHCRYPVGYGASLRLCSKQGIFTASTRGDRPGRQVMWISALRSPGYVIPRSVYERVCWIPGLRGWGATDFSVAIKSFFADVDILRIDGGGTEHLFRKNIPYSTDWESVWRNHALIARVCFDDRTWQRYWLPSVFGDLLPPGTINELNSERVLAEHAAFQQYKVRPDREFWRGLLRTHEPLTLA